MNHFVLLAAALASPPTAVPGLPLAFFGFDTDYLVSVLVSVLLFGGGGLGSLVGLVYIWIRVFKRATAAQGLANCGGCTYPVRGAGTMNCSECGADFRVVGIVSPQMRRAYLSPLVFILLWSLCLWLPATLISVAAVQLGPSTTAYYEDAEITPKDPAAAGYSSISFNRSHIGVHTSVMEDELNLGKNDFLTLDIYGPNNQANTWVEIDLNTNTYYDYYGSGTAYANFDRKTVEKWLTSVGADPKNPDVQKQIDALYAYTQSAKAQPLNTSTWPSYNVTYQTQWTDSYPALWFIAVQPLFWLVVYAAGFAVYFARRARYQREVKRLIAERAPIEAINPTSIPSAPPSQAGAKQSAAPDQTI